VVTLGTVRAKLCEEIAKTLNYSAIDRHFTVGLLSILDAVMGVPMKDVLAQIPLAPELKEVLLDPSGSSELCTALQLAMATEAGNWKVLSNLQVQAAELGQCYLKALKYEEDLRSQLTGIAA